MTEKLDQEQNIEKKIPNQQTEISFSIESSSTEDLEKKECEEFAKKHHLPKGRITKIDGEFYHIEENGKNPVLFEKWKRDMEESDKNLRWDQK